MAQQEQKDRFAYKMIEWEGLGFTRINQVLFDTDLIPNLHQLFTQNGIEVEYLIFDAMEISKGFPVPVRTRYILPIFNSGEQDPIEAYPGIAISETLGFHRSIDIQLGLDEIDLYKMERRWRAYRRNEATIELQKPDWWPYPYRAMDMTRSYDLEGGLNINRLARIAESEEDPRSLTDIYLWGKLTEDPRVHYSVLVEYETEVDDTPKRTEWQELEPDLQQGLSKIRKLLSQLVQPK